ncbi:MAG TPA: cytochrome P450 [Candidatus Baltobacteraceae bacterium]|jgi:cytochrome P450|nr:cytochrome P450 [Candidatus Baltobacteraceae bacterium]
MDAIKADRMSLITNRPNKPPGLKGDPIFGCMRQYIRDPLGFVADAARDYGSVVCFPFLWRKVYLLSGPADIEAVLMTNHANFIKTALLRTPGVQRVMGNGLVTSDGEFWRRQRRLAQPAFHHARIAAYSNVAVQFAHELLQGWRNLAVVDLRKEMMKLTLGIVAKTLFNADTKGEENEIGQSLDTCIRLFATQWTLRGIFMQRFPTPDRRRLFSAAEKLDRAVYRIIAEHRKMGDTGDLLSLLVAAQDEDGSQMTDEQLRDEAMTLFLAGHETTAITLSWIWVLLMKSPEVEAKLHDELRALLDGRLPAFEDVTKLRYTEQIVKEAMRLYPPIWAIARQSLNEFNAGGYRIPGGSEIIISQWVNHRNPAYFDNPDKFQPERWTEAFTKQLPKYAYFPFSAGPRNCIGSGFAMMEGILILATMAQSISLRRVSTNFVRPFPSITLRPEGDLRVTVISRWNEGKEDAQKPGCPARC